MRRGGRLRNVEADGAGESDAETAAGARGHGQDLLAGTCLHPETFDFGGGELSVAARRAGVDDGTAARGAVGEHGRTVADPGFRVLGDQRDGGRSTGAAEAAETRLPGNAAGNGIV